MVGCSPFPLIGADQAVLGPKPAEIKAKKRAAADNSPASYKDSPSKQRRHMSAPPDQSISVTKKGVQAIITAIQDLQRKTQYILAVLDTFKEHLADARDNLEI